MSTNEFDSSLSVELNDIHEIRDAIASYIEQHGRCVVNVIRVKTVSDVSDISVDLDFAVPRGVVHLAPDMDILEVMQDFIGLYKFFRSHFYHPDGWMSVALGYKATNDRESFQMIASIYETPPRSEQGMRNHCYYSSPKTGGLFLFSEYNLFVLYISFMAKTFLTYAYLRGEFLPFQDAHISIATHALHYGTAAFGGIRVAITDEGNALFFRLDDHAKRLSRSAHYLGYEIDPEFIRARLIEFVERNKPKTSIYIRPLVYTSDLDISPRLHDIEKDFLIYGIELGDYLAAGGVSATVSSWVRQSDASFPLRAKISGGYITSALAKSEAVERGFDEALMMNSAGKLSEGSGMNVFLVRDGTIITPGVTEDILEGITRSSVIAIARHLGYEVIERSVDKSELFIADEVFLTGTAARITPVNKIEQYVLPTDRPVFSALKSSMNDIFQRKPTPFTHWIEEIQL